MKNLILILLLLLSNCRGNNIKQNASSTMSDHVESDTLLPASRFSNGIIGVDTSSWVGEYVTDSLWVDSVKYQSDDQSPFRMLYYFGKYKLDITNDSTFFSLEITGQVPVGLYHFNYLCSANIINDTLFITTKKLLEGGEVNFTPVGKPVLKLYHQNQKIYGVGIKHGEDPDVYSLGFELESDTLEFHKIN